MTENGNKGKKSVSDIHCASCASHKTDVMNETEVVNLKGILKNPAFLMTALGVILFTAAILFNKTAESEKTLLTGILYSVALLLIGGDVYLHALKSIAKGEVFNEYFLMSLAVTGAFAISEYNEGVAVMLFYKIGEMLQEYAVEKSKKSIEKIMDLRPEKVRLRTPEGSREVSPGEAVPGDMMVVMPGERIPLDGIVVEGSSAVDMSSLTGEAFPVPVSLDNEVLSGSVNLSGLLVIRVARKFSESTVSRILTIVQESAANKSKSEKFISKFASWYTPTVVLTATGIAFLPSLLFSEAFDIWLYRALVFLVASCPCALVLSIPIGFFAGIGGASKKGILIKGGNFIESLAKIDTVIFDKTGTLTEGVFRVSEIIPAEGFTKDELIFEAAHAEMFSRHPLAIPIIEAYGKKTDEKIVSNFREIAGKGVYAQIRGKLITAGNRNFAESNITKGSKITVTNNKSSRGAAEVFIAVNGRYAGVILLRDEIRSSSTTAVKRLRQLGVRLICMLSGDSSGSVSLVEKALDLDCVHSGLLPHEKVEKLEEIMSEKKTKGNTAFVGDGINDAPVLARSDVGIAMGGIGSDAALEAADAVLMRDDPGLLADAIITSRKTIAIVGQNVVFALAVKGVVLALGATGYAAMWAAVFADVGVTVLAVLNSMRALK